MNAVDPLRNPHTCVRVARVNPALPLGIHHPKLAGDVGWDLEAMEDAVIQPYTALDVPVNLQMHLPNGYYAEIRNRSSMAKRGLYVDANIVDTGFRGPLFVMIRNMQSPSLRIKAGERVAQLLFHRTQPVWLMEVAEVNTATERAINGFGSTGR